MTIDWEAVLLLVDQRETLLMELIDIFHAEHPELMTRLGSAIDENVADDVQLYAHRLKGCLRYFGDSEAVQLAAELETCGRKAMLDGTPDLLPRLQTAIDALALEVRAYQEEHQG